MCCITPPTTKSPCSQSNPAFSRHFQDKLLTVKREERRPWSLPLQSTLLEADKECLCLLGSLCVSGLLIGEFLSTVVSKEGIDILTHLPRGSAEAEIMSVVPVFYVFHYLEAGSHWNMFYPDSLARKQSLQKKMREGKKKNLCHLTDLKQIFYFLKYLNYYESYIYIRLIVKEF